MVWDKRLDDSADKMFGSCFELIWSAKPHKRDIIRVKWAGLFGMSGSADQTRYHPTQKPAAVMGWLLERYTVGGDLVADPYVGSGTTLIACEQLGRRCRAIEIDPGYAAVTLQRWADATGGTPELTG
jgi:DNA modification methylase